MLRLLKIKNFALIDELTLELDEGLNVLTGETGAGKSIIIDSLNFVLGEKPNKGFIRNGEESLKIEALFSAPFENSVNEKLKELEIDADDGILISRTLNMAGRSDIKVNGQLMTGSMLKSLTSLLVDIHGQHEHQSLLKEKEHLKILDNYRYDKIKDLKKQVAELLAQYNDILGEINKLGSDQNNRQRMLDLLDYQIQEIKKFGVRVGEEEELRNKKDAYANSEKIIDSTKSAYDSLENATFGSVSAAIKKAENELKQVTKYVEKFNEDIDRLESVRLEIDDIIATLSNYNKEFDFDENEFNRIDNRLDNLKLLKKKYGGSEQDILNYLKKSQKDYDFFINSEARLKELEIQKAKKYLLLLDAAKKLSSARKEIAKIFEGEMVESLHDLGMVNTRFSVDFEDVIENPVINLDGFDKVRFLFSANIGQPLKSLSEIISGGEMSRFMLALKSIIAEKDKIATVVFDEIDTGISGYVGYEIACKMAKTSKTHQVLAVTHLPQICAMADNRYLITKESTKTTTKTSVKRLNDVEGISEVARLSGGDGNEESLKHAEKLIQKCNGFKK